MEQKNRVYYQTKKEIIVKRLKYSVSIAWLIFINVSYAQSQRCDAEIQMTNKPCEGETNRCVIISINSDKYGRKFKHEWEMGDGTILKGKTIEHCYANDGQYHVVMNLIDSLNGNKIRNELAKDLFIVPVPIIHSTNAGVGQESTLTLTYSTLPEFKMQNVFWDFGDGNFSCSAAATHVYDSASKFKQRVLVQGILGGQFAEVCTSKEILVQGPNVRAKILTDWFTAFEIKMPGNGRYLKDVTHLAFLDNSGNFIQTLALAKDEYVNLQAQTKYSIYAWRGNLFSKMESFTTGSAMDINQDLHQAVLRMIADNPIPLPAFQFELDNVKPANEALLSTQLSALNQYPYLHVAIGTYTHTGGYFERNEALSKQRSEGLKQFFVRNNVTTTRLRVVSANDDKRLLNSCTGSNTCAWEEERLNKRTEFKIVSPELN